MPIKTFIYNYINSYFRRTVGLSFFVLTLAMGSGCREVPGSCGPNTDNLCLAFQMAEPGVVPTTLRLTLSSLDHASLTQDFNADPILSERAYILEVAVSDPSITEVEISCDGIIRASGTAPEMVVARGYKAVPRATAERPTLILLLPDNGSGDMAGPADMANPDLRPPIDDMRKPPTDGIGSSDGISMPDI